MYFMYMTVLYVENVLYVHVLYVIKEQIRNKHLIAHLYESEFKNSQLFINTHGTNSIYKYF